LLIGKKRSSCENANSPPALDSAEKDHLLSLPFGFSAAEAYDARRATRTVAAFARTRDFLGWETRVLANAATVRREVGERE